MNFYTYFNPFYKGLGKNFYFILSKRTIMRINIAFFLILLSCLNVYSLANAQKITLQIKAGDLESVFKAIEKQTDYSFMYEVSLLAKGKEVTVQLKNVSLKEALDQIFTDLPYYYEIISKTILVKAKPLLDRGEQRKVIVVRGRVSDKSGSPLVGVSVRVRGGNVGAVTDKNGDYSIEVDADGIIVFSSVGFKTFEIRVNGQVEINFTLIELTAQLKEVTVNTGYQVIKPERFVGSATVIDSALLQRGTSRDLLSRLDGITNGLLFEKSGGALRLQLRGMSTLNSAASISGQPSTNPLIILDDFPYNGDLNNINPNDVENISVLKDAAASSIWGARAGNGVIVITTKKGNLNKPMAINFSSNLLIQSKPDLHYFPTMSSIDFVDVEQFLFNKGFHDSYLRFPSFYTISPAVEVMDKRRRGLLSEMEAQAQLDVLKQHDVRDDYDEYVLRNAVNKQNYLSISGGTRYLGYSLSLGADNDLTSIKGPGSDNRYTVNSVFSVKPYKFIELTTGINYANESQTSDGLGLRIVPGGRRTTLYPYARLADDQGNHLAIPYQYALSYIDTLATDKLLDWHYRPLDEKNFTDQTTQSQLLRLNLSAKINIMPWLNAELKYQYGKQSIDYRNLQDELTFYTRNLINSYTSPGSFNRNIPVGGILDQTFSDLNSHNVRGQLNFAHTWKDKHDFNAIVAGELGTSTLSSNSMRVYGYSDEVLTYQTNADYLTLFPQFFGGAAAIPNNLLLKDQTDRFVSFLANVSYTYDNRYSVYASGRRDGSNLFGVKTNNKWKPLWSIGGRWNISEESFYNAFWLTDLNLRASYGYSGNVNNTIAALSTIAYSGGLNSFGQQTAGINSPPNPDLRWEEVRTFNLGVDYSMLNHRISGSFEWYRKKSVDVITTLPSDPTIGVISVSKNAANLKGSGFDFQLNTKNITGNFIWGSSINVSYAKTIVSEFFQDFVATPLTPSIKKGEILGGLYAYRWAGLDPVNGDPRGYLGKEMSKNYRTIFQDSASNQVFKGSPFPLLFGNILNRFSYKEFELSFNISFRADYYFRKPSIRYDLLFNNWEGHSDYEKRWQKTGDELLTNIPSMTYPANANREQFFQYSEVNIEKGDNIRLQDLRIAYNWSGSSNSRFPIKNAQLYLYANNLNVFLWKASKSGYDPDYPTAQIPPLRNLSLGVRINL